MSNSNSEYQEWKRTNIAIGCVFARFIAVGPERHGQIIEPIAGLDPKATAAQVDARIDALINDPEAKAANLIFPDIKNLEQLVSVLMELKAFPHWSVTALPPIDHQGEQLIPMALTRMLPSSIGELPSEALVLGPFEPFPPTRRAPMVGLEIFVGEAYEADPKTGNPTTKANLAHLPVALPTRDAFDRMWEMSVVGRKNSLGGVDDPRAKAKVALVMPSELAKKIGLVT